MGLHHEPFQWMLLTKRTPDTILVFMQLLGIPLLKRVAWFPCFSKWTSFKPRCFGGVHRIFYLVGGFKHVLFFIIYGIILRTDELIFFRGVGQPPTSSWVTVGVLTVVPHVRWCASHLGPPGPEQKHHLRRRHPASCLAIGGGQQCGGSLKFLPWKLAQKLRRILRWVVRPT